MIWRLWCLLAGASLGALCGLAIWPGSTPRSLQIGALAGALLLCAGVIWLARGADGEPERGWHLARAASVGLASLPALAALRLGLGPGGAWLLSGIALALSAALVYRWSVRGPAGGSLRLLVSGVASLLVGSLVVVLLAAGVAILGGSDPVLDRRMSDAAYDIDAQIPTLPRAECDPRVARLRVLERRGAHPRSGPLGRHVWFDAEGPSGRRQIHRRDRRSGESVCWTCGEPGNNRHPAPSPRARQLLFDTDRHATPAHPADTEVHSISSEGEAGPGRPSRRLTHAPGRDEHPIYDPSGNGLLWSRGWEGRFDVVRASVQRGHGGVVLSRPVPVFPGRGRWILPLAWSVDARSLVAGAGQPHRPLSAEWLDPGRGVRLPLEIRPAGPGAVSFSADGTRVAIATTQPGGALGALPDRLGFLLERVRAARGAVPVHQGSGVWLGDVGTPLTEIVLEDVGDWGAPTGLSLDPDAAGFVLGQRRLLDAGPAEERIVHVRLVCRGDAAS